jgi:hypothetical protein
VRCNGRNIIRIIVIYLGCHHRATPQLPDLVNVLVVIVPPKLYHHLSRSDRCLPYVAFLVASSFSSHIHHLDLILHRPCLTNLYVIYLIASSFLSLEPHCSARAILIFARHHLPQPQPHHAHPHIPNLIVISITHMPP